MQAKVNELTVDHRDYITTIDDLRQVNNDAQKQSERLRIVEQDFTELRESYEKMERSYVSAVTENQQLQMKLAESTNADADETDRLKQHLTKRDEELSNVSSIVDQLRADSARLNADIQMKHEQSQQLLDENEKLKFELQEQFEYIEVDNEKAAQQQLEIESLTMRVNALQTSLDDVSKQRIELQQDNDDLTEKLRVLEVKYRQSLDGVAENRQEFEALKCEAADAESQLVQENVILQKQLIDLQSILNSKNTDGTCAAAAATETNESAGAFKDSIAKLLLPYVRIDAAAVSLADCLRLLGDTLATIDSNRADLDEIMEKFETLTKEKNRIEHDRATIKADLHHYEIEVAELMKNNEVLLLEIENLKTSGKLETISEQNEDNIICLEKQLEDCSQLNQSLEDEYQEMRDQLATVTAARQLANEEVERLSNELRRSEEQLAELQRQLGETAAKLSSTTTDDDDDRISALENDARSMAQQLSVAQDQLNEMTADTARARAVYEQKLDETQAQLIVVRNENAEMSLQFATAQTTIDELDRMRNDYHVRLSEAGKLITKKNNDIEEIIDEMRTLKLDKESLQSRLTELQSELTNAETNLDRITEELRTSEASRVQLEQTIESIQQQLVQQTESAIVVDASQSHQQALEAVTNEKAQLIALITAKHEENLTYHSEIQKLGQMLNAEMSKECLRCKDLVRQIEEVRVAAKEQMDFLREKNDVLGKSVLQESGQQQQLQQQLNAMQTEKQNLAKDLERLRVHLLEIEDAHTLETVELQKTIDSTNQKMYALQEDVRKSNTAHTSAR